MGIANVMDKIKLKRWVKHGLVIGKDFRMEKGVSIDPSFPWLIEIGDYVTIAPNALILAHDGSTKIHMNYSKIGKVKIGNKVFIGTKSVVLPNVSIGNNVIIGAGSVVSHNIPDNSIVAGVPARVISNIDSFIEKNENKMKNSHLFDSTYTLYGNVTEEKKSEMFETLKNGIAFID